MICRREMPPYWSGLVKSLSPYVPGEQPQGKKFVKLNTNENPYPPSPKALEAIRNAAGETLRLYPDPSGAELREAAAARFRIKSGQVFAGNGSDEILAFAFAAFFEPAGISRPILFPDITYSFYPVYAKLWNILFETPPLGDDFSIAPGDYHKNSGGIIFPNPNAPTGRALALEEIEKIARAQEKNRQVLIVDEAYIAFTEEGDAASVISVIDKHPNILAVRTLSKDASLAGLRTGFAVGSEVLVEALARIRDSFNSYTLDRLALAAAAAALGDKPYYDEINLRIIQTRRRTETALTALGFSVVPSQANFIFAAPPPAAGKRGQGGAEFFTALRERGILVRHFNKPRIENYLRISIGTDEDMDIFIAACEEVVKGVETWM